MKNYFSNKYFLCIIGAFIISPSFAQNHKNKRVNNFKIENNYPVGFADAGPYVDGLAAVEVNGKWGYINKKGLFIIKPKFEHGYMFQNGLVAVDINDKWGYMNTSGKTVIPFKFDEAESFEGGKAKVKLNGKYQYIDKSGKLLSIINDN